jgi:dihydrofolate synthase/folylpolyglutamate synthase
VSTTAVAGGGGGGEHGARAAQVRAQAYEAALDWLYASLNERAALSAGLGDLERRQPAWTRALLDAMGAPDVDVPALLVVGSKGKGSTAALAAAALGGVGGPVGLCTSPHLIDVRERIRVDLRAIDRDALLAGIEAVRPAGDALRRRLPSPAYQSPVGLMAAVAAVHYRRRGARFAVYEAGRGGLVDDVAELAHEVVAVTPILLEHRRELGPSLRDIARHKAGAVRPGTRVVVTGRLTAVAAAEVARAARAVGARRLALGREVRVTTLGPRGADGARPSAPEGRLEVRVETPAAAYRLEVPFAGAHQADNLAVALAAAEALAGRRLSEAATARAFAGLRWPGRLETITDADGGRVLLDGAIQPEAVARALEHARQALPAPYAAVVGAGTDKTPARLWAVAADSGAWTVVTRARAPHLRFPADAEAEAWVAGDPARRAYRPDLADALALARTHAGRTGTVVVVGTLSLIGETLALLGQDACDLVSDRR